MIDEDENGLMLVGRYGSTAKRTATMILDDNPTIVGYILKEQENFDQYDEAHAYAPNFGVAKSLKKSKLGKLQAKVIGKNKFIDSSESEGEY